MKKFDIEEVKEFIRNTSESTSIYLGADSKRYCGKDNNWYADYTLAIVIHYDGSRGCKIFGYMETERDFEQRKDRPAYRLMNEVYKVAQLYMDLAEAIGDRHAEVHLDINPDFMHGSSCVVHQAIGYIQGTCNVVPRVKPDAFAASYAADRLVEILA